MSYVVAVLVALGAALDHLSDADSKRICRIVNQVNLSKACRFRITENIVSAVLMEEPEFALWGGYFGTKTSYYKRAWLWFYFDVNGDMKSCGIRRPMQPIIIPASVVGPADRD